MKFSPRCNTKSDIRKFVIKFGNFCHWEKTGAHYWPQSCPWKICVCTLTLLHSERPKLCNFGLSECSRVKTMVTSNNIIAL